jgi:hypothetical protein
VNEEWLIALTDSKEFWQRCGAHSYSLFCGPFLKKKIKPFGSYLLPSSRDTYSVRPITKSIVSMMGMSFF